MTKSERPEEESEEAPPRGRFRAFWDQGGTLVVAIVLALAIRAFVIEPYRIPSGSMLPTLRIGDHLFVNKFVYGVKLPFVEERLPALHKPHRGDVVVFTVAERGPEIFPADRRPDLPRERFVKRIVGLPGDTIEVHDDHVYVNGTELSVTNTGHTFVDDAGHRLLVEREDLLGCVHDILDDPNQPGPDQPLMRVPAGRYFMMGDNRDWSNDSRSWGTVRLAELKGPAFVLYWSWAWDGSWVSLLNPVTWWDNLVYRTRWHRIGERIGCGRGLDVGTGSPVSYGPE